MPTAETVMDASSRRKLSTNEIRTVDGVAAAGRSPSAANAAAGMVNAVRMT